MKRRFLSKVVITSSITVIIFVFIVIMFFLLGVIWKPLDYYKVQNVINPSLPIMSMDDYLKSEGHPIPYVFKINNNKGKVLIFGASHTRDYKDPQLEVLLKEWNEFNPNVLLVEGRLGILFEWFQDPIINFGEGGLAFKLAKNNNVKCYTWEPTMDSEIEYLLKFYSAEKVSLFYSLRPYFSNYRFGKPQDPEIQLERYIKTRTNYDLLRGTLKDVQMVDSIWKNDFPHLNDWRDTSDEYGWPAGYLFDIWNLSNLYRDIYACSIVKELVNEGNSVFVVMGASHAYRIEKSLSSELTSF